MIIIIIITIIIIIIYISDKKKLDLQKYSLVLEIIWGKLGSMEKGTQTSDK